MVEARNQMHRFYVVTFTLLLSFVSHPSADQTFYACPNDCGANNGYGKCEVSDVCDNVFSSNSYVRVELTSSGS